MTTLSTHVLDTAHGCPAAAVEVELWHGEELLLAGVTNTDGRWPDLGKLDLSAGSYRLSFAVADYFRTSGVKLPDPPFLDVVRIAFGISESGHFHVPLLVSPYGYSTYRGS